MMLTTTGGPRCTVPVRCLLADRDGLATPDPRLSLWATQAGFKEAAWALIDRGASLEEAREPYMQPCVLSLALAATLRPCACCDLCCSLT